MKTVMDARLPFQASRSAVALPLDTRIADAGRAFEQPGVTHG